MSLRTTKKAARKGVQLSSGHMMPTIGLGVYKASSGGETYRAVLSALQLGYRLIDTAQVYGNEADVGAAVRDSGIPREEVFVTSKVWRANWGYNAALNSIKASLLALGTGYIDLMLLHAPGEPHTRAETWKACEDAVAKGWVRSIGVSNFGIEHIDRLVANGGAMPAVNQIEVSPFLQRQEIVHSCHRKGIAVQAYSPLSKGTMLNDPRIVGLAEELGRTPAQILLRWSIQRGLVPLPKSVSPARQAENLDVEDFDLDMDAMSVLDTLEQGLVTGWDPITSDPI